MGSQHLRIPAGYLRQLCYPGGQRLAPRINRTPPPEGDTEAVQIPTVWNGSTGSDSPLGNYSPSGTSLINSTAMAIVKPADIREMRAIAEVKKLGNLGNDMYRFFMGSNDENSLFFTCRGCLVGESGRENAARHFDNCRPLCSAIEERVNRDRVCVICNTGTQRRCWNIHLCSDLCIVKWRFMIPSAWMAARRFVVAADPSLVKLRPIRPVREEGARETLH